MRFVVRGVKHDHNGEGELLNEYWIERWDKVAEDFSQIKQLGANCVCTQGPFVRLCSDDYFAPTGHLSTTATLKVF